MVSSVILCKRAELGAGRRARGLHALLLGLTVAQRIVQDWSWKLGVQNLLWESSDILNFL